MHLDKVVVIGAGGHGKSLVSVLQAMEVGVAAIYDDDPSTWGREVLGIQVRGPASELDPHSSIPLLLGLGSNPARKAMADRFSASTWATVIYPTAYVAQSAQVGRGTVVLPGAVIGAEVVLGAHVIVSTLCTIGHDTHLGDFAHAAPGVQVAGGSSIETGAFLAIGSVVCPEVTVGEWATLAAGGVAVHDLPPHIISYGIPARPRER